MEETMQLLTQLHEDNRQLLKDIPGLVTSHERLRTLVRWSVAVGVSVVVVAVTAAALFVWRSTVYASCATDRVRALAGPSSDRVTQVLNAFTVVAAGQAPLTHRQRAKDLAALDTARSRYARVPSRSKLAKGPDSQLVIWIDVVAALDAQADYITASRTHPICTLWSL